MLSPLASAAWLLWAAALVTKLCIALYSPTERQHVTLMNHPVWPWAIRSVWVIVGLTVARMISDCPQNVHDVATFTAGVSILAIAADTIFSPSGSSSGSPPEVSRSQSVLPQLTDLRWWRLPGTAAIISSTYVLASELTLRSNLQCARQFGSVAGVCLLLSFAAVAWGPIQRNMRRPLGPGTHLRFY